MSHPTVVHWSGGKDSALALHRLRRNPAYEPRALLTTLSEEHRRITMHGVSEDLLNRQAELLGLPLRKVYLPTNASMPIYNERMGKALAQLKAEGITHAAFGDIFLENLKAYREEQMNKVGLKALFPLWQQNTTKLIHEFLELGFKTILVCIKADLLGPHFAGKLIDKEFLSQLPSEVDPCGENGEFHTFVFDGPIFSEALPLQLGERVFRTYPSPPGPGDVGFWFVELLERCA